jgi:hypothetical protein
VTFAPCRDASTREMAVLLKNGEMNSLRFLVSGSVVRDWREPVRKGLSCHMRLKGVPTRWILSCQFFWTVQNLVEFERTGCSPRDLRRGLHLA